MKLRLLSILLYLFAFWWLFFTVAWFFRDSDYRYLYSSVGAIYTLIITLTAYFIGKRKVWAWWAAVIFVGISILASILDEIGWIDLVFITAAAGLYIILLKGRYLLFKQ